MIDFNKPISKVTYKGEELPMSGGGYDLFGDWTIYNPDTSIMLESDIVTGGEISRFLGNFFQNGKPTFIQSTKSFDELEKDEFACAYLVSTTNTVISRKQNPTITFTSTPTTSTGTVILRANTNFVRMVYNYV